MKKFITTIVILLSFYACTENLTESTGSIYGTVVDKSTGEQIPVASISLNPSGKTTVTGSDGTFEFNDIDPREYTISAKKEGYNPGKNTVMVVAGKNSECHILMERIPAVVTADREVLDFGSNYSTNTLSFNIVNNHYETLHWEIINNCGWITSVSPTQGTLTHSKTGTIVVRIDRDLLADGDNVAVLVLSTEGQGSVEVTVKAYGQAKKLATLNTLEVSNISATKATFSGEIVSVGYPEYTERGFVYSEEQMPTVDKTIHRLSATITSDNIFSCNAVGLQLGKTYYIRAYAVNEMGTAYSSNQVSFKTAATAGKVNMMGIDDINLSTHTAVAHAEVTDVGDPTYSERGFVYSEINSTPTIYNSTVKVEGSDIGTFDAKLTGLAREVTYYVRAYVKNEAGVAYSENVMEFSTNESLAMVETLSATDIDEATHSAVLHGKITDVGTPTYTERGFVYSTEYEAPTVADTKIVVSGVGLDEFEARVSGFSAEATTYIRAYVKNSKGISYGTTVTVFEPPFVNLPTAGIAVQRTDINSARVDWYDANSLCNNSIVGGLTDWRLPTKDELMTMYSNREFIGGFRTTSAYYDYYWSSTPSDNCFYIINFYTGNRNTEHPIYDSYARCVRTLTK